MQEDDRPTASPFAIADRSRRQVNLPDLTERRGILQLLRVLPHRGSFLVGEPAGLLSFAAVLVAGLCVSFMVGFLLYESGWGHSSQVIGARGSGV